MSDRERARRAGRVLAVGQHKARASQRAFAQAVARSADAAAQLSHIEELMLSAGPGLADTVHDLAAAAQLRALLMPAAEAAGRRLDAANKERHEAEQKLEADQARIRRLTEIDIEARRALSTNALAREAEARPAAAPRKS
jgi:hypothetical protein